jgi:hypothetical protein
MPGVSERPHAIDAERRRYVARHGIGVDEQHVVTAAALEDGGEVGRDRGLADAPFGLNTTMTVARELQPSVSIGPP